MDKYLELKEKIFERIDANWAELIALNDDLADHPEISGQEFETSRKIVELLKRKAICNGVSVCGNRNSFQSGIRTEQS